MDSNTVCHCDMGRWGGPFVKVFARNDKSPGFDPQILTMRGMNGPIRDIAGTLLKAP